MAKKIKWKEEFVGQAELLALIKTYWKNQPGGLRIYEGKVFDCNEIREGLRKLGDLTEVTDQEIVTAHRDLLADWASHYTCERFASPELTVVLNLQIRIELLPGQSPERQQFKICFQPQIVNPIKKRNTMPADVNYSAILCGPDVED